MPILLFVYGTLRVGSSHPMARRLRSGAKLIGKGSARGALYDLGVYPGATFSPAHRTLVSGEVFALEPGTRLIAELDAYEGAEMDAVGSMYGPVEIEVALGRGGRRNALVYALKRVPTWAKPIASGDWIDHIRARAARPVRR